MSDDSLNNDIPLYGDIADLERQLEAALTLVGELRVKLERARMAQYPPTCIWSATITPPMEFPERHRADWENNS